jgi:hypothetical protein
MFGSVQITRDTATSPQRKYAPIHSAPCAVDSYSSGRSSSSSSSEKMERRTEAAQLLRTVDLTDYASLSELLQHLERKALRKDRTRDAYKWPALASIEQKLARTAELAFALILEMSCKASFTGQFRCAKLLIPRCRDAECRTCSRGHHHHSASGGGGRRRRVHEIDADMRLPLINTDLVLLLCANKRGHEVSEGANGEVLVHVKRDGFTGCPASMGNMYRLHFTHVGARWQNNERQGKNERSIHVEGD